MNTLAWSEDELQRISYRARSLCERLQLAITFADGADPRTADDRLSRWCQIVAEGDWAKFRTILNFDGLSLEEVTEIICRVPAESCADVPDWARIVRSALFDTSSEVAKKREFRERPADLSNPTRLFSSAWEPLVAVADARLRSEVPDLADLITSEAYVSLQEWLLDTLSELGHATLQLEFEVFVACTHSAALRASQHDASTALSSYLTEMPRGLLAKVLQEYPVLMRLAGTVAVQWIDTVVEFFLRFKQDRSAIECMVGHTGGALGIIKHLQCRLSDRHNGGRSVIEVECSSGSRFVYKPKHVGVEKAFNNLLSWLDANRFPVKLQTFEVIDRGSYGWTSFVDTRNCEDRSSYAERLGALLCLAYVLGAVDLHGENLISSGDHPLIVDLETIMHPEIGTGPHAPSFSGSAEPGAAYDSVLRTGLLPLWNIGLADERDLSGFSRFWDASHVCSGIPDVGIISCDCASILKGFDASYRFLVANKSILLSDQGPIFPLSQTILRLVFRATAAYARILKRATAPQSLRDGIDFSITLEALAHAGLCFDKRPSFWPLVQAERNTLACLDIPLFQVTPATTDLSLLEERDVPSLFRDSAYDRVKQRLAGLSERDLQEQIGLIVGALFAKRGYLLHRVPWITSEPIHATANGGTELDQFVDAAIDIGEMLSRTAIPLFGGSVWIHPRYSPKNNYAQYTTLGPNFFDGSCGVAVFLSYLAVVSGVERYGDLALRALQPLHGAIRHLPVLGTPIGGGIGYGSILYSLAKIGRLIDSQGVIEDARRVALHITDEAIAADVKYDVLSGAAGAILGLLTFCEDAPDGWLLSKLRRCGDHLLQNARRHPGGGWGWPSVGSNLQTGFSHGAAGIAYALLRLYRATSADQYLEAATNAVAFEDSMFVPEQGNWLDLRCPEEDEDEAYAQGWCNGAPGIGLARLGGLKILDTPSIRHDIDSAVRTCMISDLGDSDHVCCGNMGRVEFLLTSGLVLQRPQLLQHAHATAAEVLALGRSSGAYRCGSLPFFNPTFFQGCTGIGYEFLRLARPETVSSALLWE
ncbi:type 2 lanthipeptide synthetase LanM family protein [Longimicrobium sp.]|uniref:type 2 lanthipeptide synthetase LanM family protein n=1 Tax=Longimicrobium sp. TaxID=2029185 RepID=UPI002C09CA41|nr:type 2 lanthipeptide synthetase LanM family protein [Longimicrobium sp.]HSU13256.1 type 2 lanthipeptide synthetase LanM family protein [Longimicrobium sp.]